MVNETENGEVMMDDKKTYYLISNSAEFPTIHLAKRMEARGDRTGNLLRVYYVPACIGRQVGGAFGQTVKTDFADFDDYRVCLRCSKKIEEING